MDSRPKYRKVMVVDANEPDAAFVAQVAEALGRLYDPSGLLRGPLVDMLVPTEAPPDRRSRALRAALLESVESLRPAGDVPFRSLAARSYQALHLHYVEGRTAQEVAHRLAVSTRQAYRDIHKGEADLARLLWQRCRQLAAEPPRSPGQPQSAGRVLRQEVERLGLSAESVSLQQTLERAAAPLAHMAEQTQRRLPTLPRDLQVSADPVGLCQCLRAMLSTALQASAGILALDVGQDGDVAVLQLRAAEARQGSLAHLTNVLALARTLAESSGGLLRSTTEDDHVCLELRLPLHVSDTIIVIDDNEGLPILFQRYLEGSQCAVVGVSDPAEGLRLARQRPPSAIVLDILLPGADGWSLLAELKADPATASVPVIVCSVFSDVQLAISLGAAACLAKPVSASDLIQTISGLGIAT